MREVTTFFQLRKVSLWLLLLLSCCYYQDAAASDYLGADITYRCLGNDQYEINLTLYQHCNAVAMPTQITVQKSSESCGIGLSNHILPIDSSYEVPQFCPSEQANSSCVNAIGVHVGIQAAVYSAVISLPTTCTDWVIGWSSCCRDSSITTLVAPMNAGIYIEAGINNTVCNSSPIFHNAPIFYACAGVYYEYSPGLVDEEIDWQWHSFTCAMAGPDSCLNYITGLSDTIPFFADTLTLNSINGQLIFQPTGGLAQKAPLKQTMLQVNTFNDTVGYIQRDFILDVSATGGCNAPPRINGSPNWFICCAIDPTPNTRTVCAGETLVFDLIVEDREGDTVIIDPITTNLNATFGAGNWAIILNSNPPYRPDSIQVFIQIVAQAKYIGMNSFSLGFSDKICPTANKAIKSYNLIIPGVQIVNEAHRLCYGAAQTVQMNVHSYNGVGATGINAPVNGTYSWSQTSGPPIAYSSDTIKEPLVYFPDSLNYGDSITVQVTFTTTPDPVTGTQCVTTDSMTFVVDSFALDVAILSSDYSLCPNDVDTIQLSISTPLGTVNSGQYVWTTTPTIYQSSLDSSTASNPQAALTGIAGDSLTFNVNYNLGVCSGSASLELSWSSDTSILSAAMDTICPGDSIQLFAGMSNQLVNDLDFSWLPNSFISNTTISNPFIFPQENSWYYVDMNQNNCIYKDSIEIIVNSALTAPILNCGSIQDAATSILYEWGQVNGATTWEYSLDNGQTWTSALLQDSSILVTGISNGGASEIWVRAVGGNSNCAYNSLSTLVCTTIDTTVTLNALTLIASLGGPNISYQWVDCDSSFVPISGATSQSFTPSANGNYAVIISNGSSSAMSSCFNINVTNLDQQKAAESIRVYPNPTTGLVQLLNKTTASIELELIDVQGKRLLQKTITTQEASLDLTTYPAGVYMLTISSIQGVQIEKIIKF